MTSRWRSKKVMALLAAAMVATLTFVSAPSLASAQGDDVDRTEVVYLGETNCNAPIGPTITYWQAAQAPVFTICVSAQNVGTSVVDEVFVGSELLPQSFGETFYDVAPGQQVTLERVVENDSVTTPAAPPVVVPPAPTTAPPVVVPPAPTTAPPVVVPPAPTTAPPVVVPPAPTTAPPVVVPPASAKQVERLIYPGDVDCDAPGLEPVWIPSSGLVTLCFTITNVGSTTIDVALIDNEYGIETSLGALAAGASTQYRHVLDISTEELYADMRGEFLDSDDLELELTQLRAAGTITTDSINDYFEVTDMYTLAGQGPDAVIDVDLATQIQKWEALGIDNYEFVYRDSCFCFFDQATPPPWRVRVEAGEVVWARSVETNNDVPGTTISDMLATIQAKQDSNPHRLQGDFDLLYGYPTRWFVDEQYNLADEEFGQVIEYVLPLRPCGDNLITLEEVCSNPDIATLEPGFYTVRNMLTSLWLDAEGNDVFATQTMDPPTWEVKTAPDGNVYLRNVDTNKWLDTDGSTYVDLSTSPSTDDVWMAAPTWNSGFTLSAVQRGGTLRVSGGDVIRSTNGDPGLLDVWQFVPSVGHDVMTSDGISVAFQNVATGRWLDTDGAPFYNVDQSVNQAADDVWIVHDTDYGYVYLQNAVTGRYLETSGASANVETAVNPSWKALWEPVSMDDGTYQLRHAEFGSRVRAGDSSADFNVESSTENDDATRWSITIISGQIPTA